MNTGTQVSWADGYSFSHPRLGTDSPLVRGPYQGLILPLSRHVQIVKSLANCFTRNGLYVMTKRITDAHTARPLSVGMEKQADGLERKWLTSSSRRPNDGDF